MKCMQNYFVLPIYGFFICPNTQIIIIFTRKIVIEKFESEKKGTSCVVEE